MTDTTTLYTYDAITRHLIADLKDVVERQLVACGEQIDARIAEILVRALAANNADATHTVVLNCAEVYAWRVAEGDQAPYVAAVENADYCIHTFLLDMQPATLEALVKSLCQRPEHHHD